MTWLVLFGGDLNKQMADVTFAAKTFWACHCSRCIAKATSSVCLCEHFTGSLFVCRHNGGFVTLKQNVELIPECWQHSILLLLEVHSCRSLFDDDDDDEN